MQNLLVNRRDDFAVHARELATWAQIHDEKARSARGLGTIIGSVTNGGTRDGKRETRSCNYCKIKGHVEKDCRKKNGKTDFALSSVHADDLDAGDWVLDSGASVHLVRDKHMLDDTLATDECCVLTDGSKLLVTHRGTAKIVATVDGVDKCITLANACYSPKVAVNLISMGTLLEKGCTSEKCNGRLAMLHSGRMMWYVQVKSRVLVVDRDGNGQRGDTLDVGKMVLNAVRDAATERPAPTAKQAGTLVHFHLRFGHLAYDTIERMADAPRASTELTDRRRPVCIPCAEGKTTRARQPTKDTGANAPVDVIGGVICSDLKGPMTPADRRGNRYMINLICHASNYCRIFLAKRKDLAAQQFAHFLVWFEKRFQGVARQISEARNQATNGKAERMHRTIMNMVRCMLFGCGLPLKFWGDAAEYAAFVLNRMPTRANPKRASPIQVLTGKPPHFDDVVVFGSPCTVYDDPGKSALQRRAVPGIIIGKNDQTKGFRVYLPKQQMVKTTRHVSNVETLNESANERLQRALEEASDAELAELARDHETQRSQDESPQASAAVPAAAPALPTPTTSGPPATAPSPRRSQRRREESAKKRAAGDTTSGGDASSELRRRGPPLIAHVLAMSALGASRTELENLPDPKGYKATLAAPDSELWAAARQEELASIAANGTWIVVRRTPGMHTLPTQ
ncbi:TPA: hypothetical protein N0F65_011511 [Lagenidium giganteum]|uniref:Integrase catalytic domain-containing protein n=1 Tax=Lagenidium giganteum TaxID=4803 RepID=A0AAV2Z720_9STRA|nr:TPA: hypothetical protein N0F65_011511 [Lagenidium giganteum]